MHDQLCSVCLDDIQEPKCLPCLHVLCLSCLKKISHQKNSFAKQSLIELGLLQLVLLSCPICRHKLVTKENCIASFPQPKTCTKCQKYVKQVVEMCCGHRNETVCFDCLSRGHDNRISCPECGRYFTKATTRRMFLCHVCHNFFHATCKVCPYCPPIPTPYASSLELPRYSVDENIQCDRLHRLKYLSLIFIVVGILLFATYCMEFDGLSQKKFAENMCCSITVWHVDNWGNVDTTWCSGDDWKMQNAKCAMWPP